MPSARPSPDAAPTWRRWHKRWPWRRRPHRSLRSARWLRCRRIGCSRRRRRTARRCAAVRHRIVVGESGGTAPSTALLDINAQALAMTGNGETNTPIPSLPAAIRPPPTITCTANAAEYLGRGSHVNVVGRLTNNNYEPADGDRSTASRLLARRSTTSTARPSPRREGQCTPERRMAGRASATLIFQHHGVGLP